MSRPHYATITSNLLVRKGSAQPWEISAPADFGAASAAGPRLIAKDHREDARLDTEFARWMQEEDAPAQRQANQPIDHPHRCTIRLSRAEYERLGIIAVKRDMTRQQALRQAVDRYLDAAKRQYSARCRCLGDQASATDCMAAVCDPFQC